MEKEYIKHLQQVKKVGTKLYIDDLHDVVPVGTILYTASPTPPNGYLICNGATVGRGTYPDLFAAIGTTYGDGDGSTTFQLPNLMDKTVWGGTGVGTEKEAGLPNIKGDFSTIDAGSIELPTGALSADQVIVPSDPSAPIEGLKSTSYSQHSVSGDHWNLYDYLVKYDASRSNPIYGNSDTVQPPATVLLPVIKAFGHIANPGDLDAAKLAQDMLGYLPLSGGTMTGTIQVRSRVPGDIDSEPITILGTDSTKELCIAADPDPHHGPFLALYGTRLTYGETKDEGVVDYSDKAGYFAIGARRPDPSDSSKTLFTPLEGYPDGRLLWGGTPVECLMESAVIDSANYHYRFHKYSNGWLTYQGRILVPAGVTHVTVSLVYPYLLDNYTAVATSDSIYGDSVATIGNKSTTWVDIHRRRCTDLAYSFDTTCSFFLAGQWKRPFNQ